MCNAGRNLCRQISFKAEEWEGDLAGISSQEGFSSFQRRREKNRDRERINDTCLLKPLMEDSLRRPIKLAVLLFHFLTGSYLRLSCQPRHLCISALEG